MINTLKLKLPVAIVGLGLLSASTMGLIGWMGARSGLESAAFEKLHLAAQSRRTSLELISERLQLDVAGIARHKQVLDNIADLSETLASSDAELAKNIAAFTSVPASERETIDGAGIATMYGLRHSKVHPVLSAWRTQGHYDDILLLDLNGRVVYSVTKGLEFGQALGSPEIEGSGLDELFDMFGKTEMNTVLFHDFVFSKLADGKPAAFIAAPIWRKSNVAMDRAQEDVRVGYAVIRIGTSVLERVLNARDGLGETGETFAVGADGLIRTNAPLELEPTAGKPLKVLGIDNTQVSGRSVANGQEQLAAHSEAEFLGAKWTVFAKQSAAEALKSVDEMSHWMWVAALVILTAQVVIGFLFGRSITGPIAALTQMLGKLARGENTGDMTAKSRRDEIGDISRAVEDIRAFTIAEAERRAALAEEERRHQEEERRRMTADLAREFQTRVGSVIKTVAAAAADLEGSAREMARKSEESKAGSLKVAASSGMANQEVQSVAAASEQLSASIREVSSLAVRSGTIATEAGEHAQQTNQIVVSLAQKASRIKSIIDMIQAIAEQTNLLALNATIEAARAGDAGKGFAVVASEVKALASQTGKATEDIAGQIGAIAQEVEQAVGAVNRISAVIEHISEAAGSIAAAIEQQTAATTEIAKSAMSAAGETSVVTSAIGDVSAAINTTDGAANTVVERARSLGREANDLDKSLHTFLNQLLAA